MAKKNKELRPLCVDVPTLRAYIKKYCEDNDYPNNAESSLLQVLDEMKLHDFAFTHRFLCPVDDYFNDRPVDFNKTTSPKVYFSMTNSVAKKLEISNMPLAMTFYYCLLPHLEKKYEEAGYSQELFRDSVNYLLSKMYECYKVFGTWGSFIVPSYSKIFTMEQFGFGSVSYTVVKAPETFTCNGKKVEKGTKVIQVLLPSIQLPTVEELKDSMKKAYEFFKKDLGEEVCFYLESWMLYPVHRSFIPETDRIIGIMDTFRLVKTVKTPKNPDYWCIFHRFYKKNDKESLFISLPLELRYDEYIRGGNCMGRGTGLLFYNGKDFI